MNRSVVIVVFGLPGAGKTTLINAFIQGRNEFVRLSGGSLINEDIAEADRDTLRKQGKEDVQNNQEKLVVNFARKKQEYSDRHILFDGHCLVKNSDAVVAIPVEIIRGLTPDLILFVDEDAKTIINRRKNDSSRPDREDETALDIDKNRNLQVKICQEYSKILNVPFVSLKGATPDSISELIVAYFPDIGLE